MAEEKKEGETKEEKKSGPGLGAKLDLLLPLTNLVAILATAGLLVYTKLVFKRPPITEQNERLKLEKETQISSSIFESGTMLFEPTTINIRSTPIEPQADPTGAQQIAGKLHYVNVGMTLELRDITKKEGLEELRPVIMDKIISIMGRKTFQELITVQGRYILRTQISDLVNEIATQAKLLPNDGSRTVPLITNVYFSQFLVQ